MKTGQQKRGLFSWFFDKQPKNPPRAPGGASYAVINESDSNGWYSSGDANLNDIISSCIYTNSKNAGKLNVKHIRKNGDKYDIFPIPQLKRVLTRPNKIMGMSEFLKKMVALCEDKSNAFALIKFGGSGYAEGLYPIDYYRAEAFEVGGDYFVKFWLKKDGKNMTVPYQQLIHIRGRYKDKELFGDTNNSLTLLDEVVQTTDKGIIKAVRTSSILRWLLKFNNNLKPEDIQEHIDTFVNNFMDVENGKGVAGTDPRYEAKQIEPKNYIPTAAQNEKTVQRIYACFGVNEKIIKSDFNSDVWNAYYENVLEPYAIQLSEEFTEKLFTQDQRDRGNLIVFEANRLQYSTNKEKVEVGTFLTNVGALTLDQVLDIFNYAPIGGNEGKRRVQTLNVINAQKADQYQIGGQKDDGSD